MHLVFLRVLRGSLFFSIYLNDSCALWMVKHFDLVLDFVDID